MTENFKRISTRIKDNIENHTFLYKNNKLEKNSHFSASIFRKRAQTDQTGFVRLIGDLTALFVAFGAARWIMGAYLGDMATQDILGGFLVTALLFLPVRPFFLLKKEEWVDA